MESCGQDKDYGEERKLWEKCGAAERDTGLEREKRELRGIELCGKHRGLHGEGGRMEKQGIIGEMGGLWEILILTKMLLVF